MSSITEAQGSRPLNVDGIRSTFVKKWNLRQFGNEGAALLALAATSPTVIVDGVELAGRTFSLEPKGKTGDGNYNGTVNYKHVSKIPAQDRPTNLNDEKINFQFTMPNSFFTKAISQTKIDGTPKSPVFGEEYPPAKDVGFGINVLIDGTVEGLDVPIPGDGLQVTTRRDIGNLAASNAWLKDTVAQLGTKNEAEFRAHDAGDSLFRSFSGTQQANDEFEFTFDFASKIGEDFTSAPLDTGLVTFPINQLVKGFDLVWIMYEQREIKADNTIIPWPRGLYIAKVFEDSDFGRLGIIQ